MAYGRWKPSRTKAQEFKEEMERIDTFLHEHPDVSRSWNGDSYYFEINGQKYRVSNHSVEASNRGAYDCMGNQIRPLYHEDGREDDTRYIHASKTRIIEIYEELIAGKVLDGRGYPV